MLLHSISSIQDVCIRICNTQADVFVFFLTLKFSYFPPSLSLLEVPLTWLRVFLGISVTRYELSYVYLSVECPPGARAIDQHCKLRHSPYKGLYIQLIRFFLSFWCMRLFAHDTIHVHNWLVSVAKYSRHSSQ